MDKPEIKVIYRKLGKERAIGLAYCEDRIIHIDSRLKGQHKLEILCHELLHCMQPKWAEDKVIGNARELSKHLWNQGLRFIEEEK